MTVPSDERASSRCFLLEFLATLGAGADMNGVICLCACRQQFHGWLVEPDQFCVRCWAFCWFLQNSWLDAAPVFLFLFLVMLQQLLLCSRVRLVGTFFWNNVLRVNYCNGLITYSSICVWSKHPVNRVLEVSWVVLVASCRFYVMAFDLCAREFLVRVRFPYLLRIAFDFTSFFRRRPFPQHGVGGPAAATQAMMLCSVRSHCVSWRWSTAVLAKLVTENVQGTMPKTWKAFPSFFSWFACPLFHHFFFAQKNTVVSTGQGLTSLMHGLPLRWLVLIPCDW